jgi:hypothetical protein
VVRLDRRANRFRFNRAKAIGFWNCYNGTGNQSCVELPVNPTLPVNRQIGLQPNGLGR